MARQDPGLHRLRGLMPQFMGVAVLLVAAKLAGAVKEILLARAYGVSPLMDAYQFILQLIGWPISIFLAIATAALVPAYAGLRQQDVASLLCLRRQAHGATFVLCGLCLLGWILLCLRTPLLTSWAGLTPETQAQATAMAVPMAVVLAGGFYVALLSVECISEQRQGSVLLEATPAVLLGLALWLVAEPGVEVLVWGTVAGAAVHTLVLAGYGARHIGLPKPSLRFDHPQWPALIAALGTLLLAQVVQATTAIVDQLWAARAGNGALSVIGYANRILFLVLGIGSVAISRVVLPTLADFSAQGGDAARVTAVSWALRLFGLLGLVVALLWPLSGWGVALLFERGAFGAAETRAVAQFLQMSWLQIPAALAGLVLIQQLLAERRYRTLVVIALLNLAVKLVGNTVLVPLMGIEGLALSTAFMHLATLFMLLVWGRWRRHA